MDNNYDGTNIKQLEDLNFYSMFNNKTLWSKWFRDSELENGIRKKCRQIVDDEVFSLNWRTSVGVTVDWKYAGHHWGDSPLINEFGEYKSIFLDFRQSYLEKGKENKSSNYLINVYNCYKKQTFALPHRAIMTYWSAGWPRHGWYPGKYVTEPWGLLKPIQDFLNCTLPYKKLLRITEYRKLKPQQEVFRFVYENIYPLIKAYETLPVKHGIEWRTKLHKLYGEAININLLEFEQRYNPRNPYTGPSDGEFPIEWFDDPEKMNNPFLRFYRRLRNEKADELKDAKSMFLKIDQLADDTTNKQT